LFEALKAASLLLTSSWSASESQTKMDRMAVTGQWVNHLPHARWTHDNDMEGVGEGEEEQEEDVV
jgi:hypothetical protein